MKQNMKFSFALLSICSLLLLGSLTCHGEDWPQWRGVHRDGKWHESGIVDSFGAETMEPVWRTPIGPGYTGPTVSDGKVYVMDRVKEPQQERILCFSAADGTPLWNQTYACAYEGIGYKAGPRAAVTIHQGSAIALGAMGNLHCLDAATGKIKWQRDLAAEYDIAGTEDRQTRMPIWGIAASPLVVNDLVILHIGGREGACVVAHRLSDGEPVWRALEDRAQYSSPILIRQADQDVVVVWTGDGIAGLDPASGKVHWHELMTPVNMPIGIATPIVRGDRIFVTSFYDGAMMLNISSTELTADVVWQKRGRSEKETDGLHSIISTPVWLGEHIYGVDSYGELRCLIAETGERVWEDLSATPKARWSNIHFVQHGDRMWMFNERGELIIGKLSPEGFAEIDRAKLLEPTKDQLNRRGGVCWSHPAFANKHIFVRNDEELVCASLAAGSEIDP